LVAHLTSRNPLIAYFTIAFGLTWLLQIPALLLAYANDQPIGNEDNLRYLFDLVRGRLTTGELTSYLLFLLGAGPVIAAVVVLGATQGREGIRDLLRRMANWRIPAR
jgi:hypothetical protein